MPSCYRMDSCMLLLTPLCERCPHRWSTNVPTGVFISMLLYALPVVARELPTHNREKIFLKRGLTYLIEYAIT